MFQFFLSSLPRVTLISPTGSGSSSAITPSESIGTVTLASPVGAGAGVGIIPAETLGTVTLVLGVGSGTGTTIAPSESIGAVALAALVGSASGSGIAPSESIGAVSLAPSTASGTGTTIAPNEIVGAVSVSASSAGAAGSGDDPGVALSSVSMALDVNASAAIGLAPALDLGGVSLLAGAGDAQTLVTTPDVSLGNVSAFPDEAIAAASAADIDLLLSAALLVPDPAVALSWAIDPLLSTTTAPPVFHFHAEHSASIKIWSTYASPSIHVEDAIASTIDVSQVSCVPVMMGRATHKASFAITARVYIMDNLDERYFIVNGSFAVTISACSQFSDVDLSAKEVAWELVDVATLQIMANGTAEYVGTETDASSGKTLYVFRATITAEQAASMEVRKSYAVDFSEPTTGLGKRVGPRTAAYY